MRLPLLLPVFLLLLFTACNPPATEADPSPVQDPVADKTAPRQLIQDIFDNIWAGTDTSYVARYQTDDFILLEHGEVWTNDTIRNYQLRKLANLKPDAPERRNSFEFYRTEALGDDIWMAYQNTGHWVTAEGDTTYTGRWLESAVATRVGDGWKLRMMHSTRN